MPVCGHAGVDCGDKNVMYRLCLPSPGGIPPLPRRGRKLAELVPCPDLVSRMVSCRAAAYMARKGTPDKTVPPSPPRRAEAVCGVPWPRAGCYARGCFWLGPEGDFGAGRRTVLTSFVWLTEAVLHCVKWRAVVPRPKARTRWLVLRLVPADFKQSCHGRLVVTGWRRLILRWGLALARSNPVAGYNNAARNNAVPLLPAVRSPTHRSTTPARTHPPHQRSLR
jgi:hypothetical protein